MSHHPNLPVEVTLIAERTRGILLFRRDIASLENEAIYSILSTFQLFEACAQYIDEIKYSTQNQICIYLPYCLENEICDV